MPDNAENSSDRQFELERELWERTGDTVFAYDAEGNPIVADKPTGATPLDDLILEAEG